MRLLVSILLFSVYLFAYKDSFYIGGFSTSYNGKMTTKGSEIHSAYPAINKDFDITGGGNGIRFGEDFNTNKEHTSKMRWELSYEPRVYKYDVDGDKFEIKGHRAAASMYLGKNLDLLLNHETTVFFKMSFGYNEMDEIGQGTDEVFGVGAFYSTRIFELQFGIDREYRRWGAYILIPYDFFDYDKHVEETDVAYAGINIKF